MTPQERDLITHLLERLAQAGGQPKDPEADQLIRQAVAAQPDAPYYLAQTVLIQDMALSNAQSRIQALEQQLAAAKPAPAQPTSFLGGLFGGGPASTNPTAGSVPSAGPWSRPAPVAPAQAAPQWQGQPGQGQPGQGQPAQGQPGYGQSGYGQPGYGQPMGMGGPMMGMGGGSGFLRSAATTAAGIAGGALLFQGIQSMFGSHAGGILSGTSMQPGLSETVINNYYGSDPAAGGAPQTAAWDQGTDNGAQPADYSADNASDTDQDFASDQDFGGGDSDSV
jgi:hypothetical protein